MWAAFICNGNFFLSSTTGVVPLLEWWLLIESLLLGLALPLALALPWALSPPLTSDLLLNFLLVSSLSGFLWGWLDLLKALPRYRYDLILCRLFLVRRNNVIRILLFLALSRIDLLSLLLCTRISTVATSSLLFPCKRHNLLGYSVICILSEIWSRELVLNWCLCIIVEVGKWIARGLWILSLILIPLSLCGPCLLCSSWSVETTSRLLILLLCFGSLLEDLFGNGVVLIALVLGLEVVGAWEMISADPLAIEGWWLWVA